MLACPFRLELDARRFRSVHPFFWKGGAGGGGQIPVEGTVVAVTVSAIAEQNRKKIQENITAKHQGKKESRYSPPTHTQQTKSLS